MRIGGEEVYSSSTMDVVLPYDGSVVARVYTGDGEMLARAIAAAKEGAAAMAKLRPYERADLLEPRPPTDGIHSANR